MNTRSLKRRIKKARLDVVLNDKNVKICDSFQDLVELHPDDEEPLMKQNPKLKLIYTARYSKMMKELEEYYLENKDKGDDYDPYEDLNDDDEDEVVNIDDDEEPSVNEGDDKHQGCRNIPTKLNR